MLSSIHYLLGYMRKEFPETQGFSKHRFAFKETEGKLMLRFKVRYATKTRKVDMVFHTAHFDIQLSGVIDHICYSIHSMVQEDARKED